MGADVAYLVLGAGLCVLLAVIAVLTFRPKRKDRIEAPKYRMMDDD